MNIERNPVKIHPLFVSIKKATVMGRITWLPAAEKRRPKKRRENPRVQKEGDIPTLRRAGKRRKKE
jgi:hypothetical protein